MSAIAIPLGDLSLAQAQAVGFLARYTGSTYDLYRRYLGQWFAWCDEQRLDPLQVERTHVELYVRQLGQTMKPSSVCSAMNPVRGFYKLACMDGVIDRDPAAYARLPKVQYATKPLFDRDDLRRLIAAAREISTRHHALVLMLSSMGLRVSEACSINVPDIFNTEQGCRVLRFIGKGSKPAAVPIPYQAIPVLEDVAGDRRTGPLLTLVNGRRLTRSAAASLVRVAAQKAGFTRTVNPHLLRAAAITMLLDSGVDLRDAQDFARHEDPRTTRQHYDLHRERWATHASHLAAAKLAI
ncbi:tyrosine recombinase XerC [Nocardioides maradonensis]